jgi:ABC-type proline/glycine betaine transport system ATPase subunit
MTEALLMGDRIIVMREGHVVGQGPPREMLRHSADPYVARLMESPTRQTERLAAMAGNDRSRP